MHERLLQKANKLPMLPGVYIMKDAEDNVIYVGKAKKLKNRVTSYFRGSHLPKVEAMVEKVNDFSVIVVESEFESLVLENSLIKQYKPHYNILLKDDKGYPFIRLCTDEPYPKFEPINVRKDDGARYFGPFGGRSVSREIIDVVCKTLKLPSCSRSFPRDIGKNRPCLNFHMWSCSGWCRPPERREEYAALISEACLILEGKRKELAQKLKAEMEQASEELRFELAAELRDRMRAVETNKQNVIAPAFSETDAVGFFRGAKTCFTVLHFYNGALREKDTMLIDEPLESDEEAISQLLRQYYMQRSAFPKHILLPMEPEDREELEHLFSDAAGERVYLEVPKRGERLGLVTKALVNAKEETLRATSAQQRRTSALKWLQKALDLNDYPTRIEAFDVSNLGDTGIVAAMTVHRDGKPLKRDYRKFKISDLEQRDDYASMHQAVYRRFKRYCDGSSGFTELPQLLLIDGGDRHAAVAEEALSELGLTIQVFGMVKDDRHRTRALISSDGREIGINANQAVFSLVGRIQEETHRYAIEYQRSLRSGALGSELNSIPGVGDKRRNELLRHFKTLKAIKNASLEELCEAVPKNCAHAVYEHYHGSEDLK
ncbi:MAG: excinuclease ABC subunit UvrC [Oscillospiraceae bacterium]|nr:excinuclease ABC subunit UvrC [Oscillospiraceae bacterium]